MRITIDQEEDDAKHFDARKKQSTKQKVKQQPKLRWWQQQRYS
jgi:hypothetical protein